MRTELAVGMSGPPSGSTWGTSALEIRCTRTRASQTYFPMWTPTATTLPPTSARACVLWMTAAASLSWTTPSLRDWRRHPACPAPQKSRISRLLASPLVFMGSILKKATLGTCDERASGAPMSRRSTRATHPRTNTALSLRYPAFSKPPALRFLVSRTQCRVPPRRLAQLADSTGQSPHKKP
jgi:hypothetical protein